MNKLTSLIAVAKSISIRALLWLVLCWLLIGCQRTFRQATEVSATPTTGRSAVTNVQPTTTSARPVATPTAVRPEHRLTFSAANGITTSSDLQNLLVLTRTALTNIYEPPRSFIEDAPDDMHERYYDQMLLRHQQLELLARQARVDGPFSVLQAITTDGGYIAALVDNHGYPLLFGMPLGDAIVWQASPASSILDPTGSIRLFDFTEDGQLTLPSEVWQLMAIPYTTAAQFMQSTNGKIALGIADPITTEPAAVFTPEELGGEPIMRLDRTDDVYAITEDGRLAYQTTEIHESTGQPLTALAYFAPADDSRISKVGTHIEIDGSRSTNHLYVEMEEPNQAYIIDRRTRDVFPVNASNSIQRVDLNGIVYKVDSYMASVERPSVGLFSAQLFEEEQVYVLSYIEFTIIDGALRIAVDETERGAVTVLPEAGKQFAQVVTASDFHGHSYYMGIFDDETRAIVDLERAITYRIDPETGRVAYRSTIFDVEVDDEGTYRLLFVDRMPLERGVTWITFHYEANPTLGRLFPVTVKNMSNSTAIHYLATLDHEGQIGGGRGNEERNATMQAHPEYAALFNSRDGGAVISAIMQYIVSVTRHMPVDDAAEWLSADRCLPVQTANGIRCWQPSEGVTLHFLEEKYSPSLIPISYDLFGRHDIAYKTYYAFELTDKGQLMIYGVAPHPGGSLTSWNYVSTFRAAFEALAAAVDSSNRIPEAHWYRSNSIIRDYNLIMNAIIVTPTSPSRSTIPFYPEKP